MADSFYGGKQGLSIIIKDTFESIADAVAACKRGPEYTRTWYNELLIISTPNLNDEDNGKVFRRGLEYNNDMGGLELIAQIVGPCGGTPLFQMNTIKEVKDKSTMAIGEDDYRRYPIGYETDDEGHVTGYKINTDANEPIATFPFSKAHDTSLVPGKTDDGRFNDEILWTWCNIRKPNQESDSWFYVGFTIPYLVTEYQTHTMSQYDGNGNIVSNPTEIDRVDDKSHPFYQKWDIGLPKGIKGDTLRNLRIITPTSADKSRIYAPSAITVNGTTGVVSVGAAGYSGIDDDIANKRQILVYDFYYYDKKLNPTPIMVYLGDWNVVKNVDVADDGTLTVSYTHNNNTVFSRKIKWINEVTLSPDSGVFTVTYNNGSPAFTTTLDWIKDIELDDDGTIHFIHTKDNRDEYYNNKIKWVTSVDLNTANGIFTMNFNYGEPLVRTLDWVDDININEDTGDITIHKVNSGNTILDAKLKLVTSAYASSTGVVTFYTNTGESFNIKKMDDKEEDFQIRSIDNVRLNTRLADDKHIQIKYNTASDYTNIGDPINYIGDMIVRSSDLHLLVLFTDPEHRASAGDLDDDGVDANGHIWVNNVVGTDGVNTGDAIYWRDYGTIKDQSGILVGRDVSTEDINSSPWADEGILGYLNNTYPAGLQGEGLDQKIVTHTPEGSSQKEFYAFDYNKYEWYLLGSIGDDGRRDVKLLVRGEYGSSDLTNLSTNGLLFVEIKSTNLKTTPIPDYWSRTYNQWV